MSTNYLLTQPTPANLNSWQFEHAMAHRELTGAMSQPPTLTDFPGGLFALGGGLTHFSALPYLIDPQLDVGMWHLDHAQAHADFQHTLPAYFGFDIAEVINPTDPGFTSMQFADRGLLTWWTFSNHQQHLVAQTVLPETLNLPFW